MTAREAKRIVLAMLAGSIDAIVIIDDLELSEADYARLHAAMQDTANELSRRAGFDSTMAGVSGTEIALAVLGKRGRKYLAD